MIDAIRDVADGIPEVVQWIILFVIGAVPFLEGYGAAFLGIVAGVHPALAIALGVLGNVLSMLLFVAGGRYVHQRSGVPDEQLSPRQLRLRRALDRWGVPVVGIIGPSILPSQLTAAAMVGFGVRRGPVIIWTTLGIIIWAVLAGLLALAITGSFG
ncbi:MAG: hypothetical protein Q4G67_14535 [Actinomycetia bacterium]|nr:hypothetical protein [Actinomycetes bacterium]